MTHTLYFTQKTSTNLYPPKNLISHANKLYKPDLEKAEEPELKLLIIGKLRELQRNIHFFIEYTKASMTLWITKKLWKIFKEMGIADHLTWFLGNLNAGQEATVRIRHGDSELFQNWERNMSRLYIIILLI